MTLYIVSALTGLILIGYIVYLRIQLARKNIFIETTVKRLSGIERSRSMDEMMEFLREIQKASQFSSYFSDRFPDDNLLNFILENSQEMDIWLHYTREEPAAKKILEEGFIYSVSFHKTAETVTDDRLDLLNKHNVRKSFGDYIVIIAIARETVRYYSSELLKAGISNYSVENLLSVRLQYDNEDADQVYRLAAQFVKGYINFRTGETVINPLFDPWFNPSLFKNNFEDLKRS